MDVFLVIQLILIYLFQARNVVLVVEHYTQDMDKDFILKNTRNIQDACLRETHAHFSELCKADKIMSQILYEYCIATRKSVTCVLTPEEARAVLHTESVPDVVYLIRFFYFL
jgi:hypothetical protein